MSKGEAQLFPTPK